MRNQLCGWTIYIKDQWQQQLEMGYMQMETLNILALWGVPKEILLLGAGGFVIVVGAIVAWFVLGDSDDDKTDEETEKPKKEK